MKEKLEEINDWIREAIPLMIFTSWVCMVVFVVKMLLFGR